MLNLAESCSITEGWTNLNRNDSPRLLVIETSGRGGSVAVASGSELLAVQHLEESRRHARDLAPVTAALLGERGWKPPELAAVIVSLGPGSYTGLRVGLMSAKVLAYSTGCALIGVDTFLALALQVPDEASEFVDVIADAQQDKVYVQRFARSPGTWREFSALSIAPFAEWQANRGPRAWVTGPGLHRRSGDVTEGERVTPESCWNPRPESLLRLGLARYLTGERDDPYRIEPRYLRPSSAEQQWQDRGRQ